MGSMAFAAGIGIDLVAVWLAGRRSLIVPAWVLGFNWLGVMLVTSLTGQKDPALAFIAFDFLSAVVILWNGGHFAVKLSGVYWVAIVWSGLYLLTGRISEAQYLWVLFCGGAGQIVILFMEAVDGTGRKARSRRPARAGAGHLVAADAPRRRPGG